jgi:hypothetical protein
MPERIHRGEGKDSCTRRSKGREPACREAKGSALARAIQKAANLEQYDKNVELWHSFDKAINGVKLLTDDRLFSEPIQLAAEKLGERVNPFSPSH